MKAYIADIIPKITRYSKKLDELTLLTNQHWVVIDEEDSSKNVYIFRCNSILLISKNGRVEKAKWEYLGQNTLLIDRENESYLFKQGFFDENILALKIDGDDKYVFFVNESKHQTELNTINQVISFLRINYIDSPPVIFDGNLRIKSEIRRHSIPEYTESYIETIHPFLGRKVRVYNVNFDDGVHGKIYISPEGDLNYFLAKPESSWTSYKCIYKDNHSCIVALHYFKTHNTVLKENLIRQV